MYNLLYHNRQLFCFAFVLIFISACSTAPVIDPSVMIKSKPLITFVFDDGNETDYTVAKDIFSARGEVASTAVVTGWINTKDYLSVSQLTELQQTGWEIMGHTVSHPNLRDLSESQLEAELSQSKAALEGWGIHVRNMVYPYNKSNETVRRIAAKYYRAGRAGQKMMNSPGSDPYDLKSYSCELSFWHKMDDIKGLIDRAYSEKKWLILYQHLIDAKIRISGKRGVFVPGEMLSFIPSGAAGKYIKDSLWSIQFVPLSGTPQPGDTVTGLSSGASAKLWEVYYNEREALTEMIEYVHKKYPDMQIVTIDKGLDLLEIR
ncbi:MAG: polysaccharide deacetylase family protein [Nitrospirae bacterium]|nr:polysaccharide deacetylase family protein [Nitrospirota bacterium]